MTSSSLTARTCRAASASKLNDAQIELLLGEIPMWKRDADSIARTVSARSYSRTMALAVAVAMIAEAENHHPEMCVGYSKLTVRFSTHSAGGLSELDFIAAAKVDELIERS